MHLFPDMFMEIWGCEEVEETADGDFMAQTGEGLREECWLPDKMKHFLHWIQHLHYYIIKSSVWSELLF